MLPIAILHEGNTGNAEQDLLRQLMQHLQLDDKQCEFYAMGGKSNFFKADYKDYLTLKDQVAADQISSILFVLDADDVKNDARYGGYANTECALEEIIRQFGWQDLSSCFIMCDPYTKTGYLESFLLASISEAQKQCITAFLACSNFKSKDNHKAILNQIYKIAYPQAPYDFQHENFDSLKQVLRSLFD